MPQLDFEHYPFLSQFFWLFTSFIILYICAAKIILPRISKIMEVRDNTIKNALESLTGTELFAAEIYFLSTLPAKVDPHEVINVIIMAIVLSFLSSVYPAWRASRIAPAEALRYG